jgi:hypothetical protein
MSATVAISASQRLVVPLLLNARSFRFVLLSLLAAELLRAKLSGLHPVELSRECRAVH